MEKTFITSWSGGKDSSFAFFKAIEKGYIPKALLTVCNSSTEKSRSHGIPKNILQAQASSIGVPISFFSSSWDQYEYHFARHLQKIQQTHGTSHAVFGDIDILSHRQWEEKMAQKANMQAVLPLWQQDKKTLVLQMIAQGIKAIIVSCNTHLGAAFIGKPITLETIKLLEEKGVDVCGENGEYHTLVTDAPFFKHPLYVQVKQVCITPEKHYYFADLELEN